MSRVLEQQDAAFGAAMRAHGGNFQANGKRKPPLPAGPPKLAAPEPALKRSEIELGRDERGGRVVLDLPTLLTGRLLVQGLSGAGKSWTLRRILEQTAGRVQQVVIDPEGEFASLAERLEHLRVDASRLDGATLAKLAARVREQRASVVLDLSDLDSDRRLIAFAPFVRALVEAPAEHWHTTLVAVDEAHLFAPFGGHVTAVASVRKAAIGALIDLMSRGRKRGLAGVLATQRLARLSKSVASEVQNFLIGLNTLDLDIRRAAEAIGWDARRAFDRLPMLKPGDFVAVGSAFSQSPAVLRVGSVESAHRGAAPALAAPDAIDPATAATRMGLEELIAESDLREDDELGEEARAERGAIRKFVRDPGFALAGALYCALKELVPDGARLVDLAKALKADVEALVAAVALLELHGIVELSEPVEDVRAAAARIAPDFAKWRL